MPELPAAMVEAAARALHEHDRIEIAGDPLWEALNEDDQDSYRAAVRAGLAAALSTCTIRKEWRYVLEDGETTLWGWGNALLPVDEYLAADPPPDCRKLPVVHRQRRLVIETPPEVSDGQG